MVQKFWPGHMIPCRTATSIHYITPNVPVETGTYIIVAHHRLEGERSTPHESKGLNQPKSST